MSIFFSCTRFSDNTLSKFFINSNLVISLTSASFNSLYNNVSDEAVFKSFFNVSLNSLLYLSNKSLFILPFLFKLDILFNNFLY